MDRLRLRSESGFTLIELLVVVAIIGILAAIAIPQFAAYRRRGYEAQVKSDLRNAATAQEAYFANAFTYKGGADNRVPIIVSQFSVSKRGGCMKPAPLLLFLLSI